MAYKSIQAAEVVELLSKDEVERIRAGFDPVELILQAQGAFSQSYDAIYVQIQTVIDFFFLSDVGIRIERYRPTFGAEGERRHPDGADAATKKQFLARREIFARYLQNTKRQRPKAAAAHWAQLREALLIGSLAAQRADEYLAVHFLWGLQCGLSLEEMTDFVHLQALYAGGIASFHRGLLTLRRTVTAMKKALPDGGKPLESADAMDAIRDEFGTTPREIEEVAKIFAQLFQGNGGRNSVAGGMRAEAAPDFERLAALIMQR